MRIIAFKTIKDFFERPEYADAEISLRAWHHEAKQAEWKNSNELKKQFRNPSLIPDPVDAIKFRMEQMGMSNSDMVKYLGSQSRVSEVLNRKRRLMLGMIKSLYKGLKIPAEVLLA